MENNQGMEINIACSRFSKRGCSEKERERGRERRIVAPPAPRFCSISQNRSSVPDQGSNTRSLHARRDHRLPRYTTKNISRPAMLSRPPSIYIGTVAGNRPSIERAFHPPRRENRTDERVISRLSPSFP